MRCTGFFKPAVRGCPMSTFATLIIAVATCAACGGRAHTCDEADCTERCQGRGYPVGVCSDGNCAEADGDADADGDSDSDGDSGACAAVDLDDMGGDGIADTDEGGGGIDTDGDGMPDFLDFDSDNTPLAGTTETGPACRDFAALPL